jgi:hypothetical protein
VSRILTAHLPGKRIALPTRVEPKVFFANERTFLSWLNFTVILGGLAVGLLNFGDSVGRISAGLFTIVAMAAMIYALATFHWRAKSIRQRGQGGFDDRYGPTVLTRNKRRDKVGIEEEMKGLLVISISKFMGRCIPRHERHRFGRR